MARPTKWRKIENIPSVSYFVPSDKEIEGTPQNILKLEELEALRLKDLEGLGQDECADKMEVSRPTFQRILFSAREIIADCLINGKTIHIEGGNYTKNICSITCFDCGNKWTESLENLKSPCRESYVCPVCGSEKITCSDSCRGKFGRRDCWQHGSMDHR